MIYILHGDNSTHSRTRLLSLINHAKQAGKRVEVVDARKANPAQIEQILSGPSLFGDELLVVLEQLHALTSKKRLEEITTLIKPASCDLILWENKTLTATKLKAFSGAKVEEFKASSQLFTCMDALNHNPQTKSHQLTLLHAAISSDGEQFVLAMLCRQVRLLIQAKDNHPLKAPPFVVGKLKKQAVGFTLEQLLNAHQQLLEIESRAKSGKKILDLTQELDLFVLAL